MTTSLTRTFFLAALLLFLAVPLTSAFAQELRITEGGETTISDPEAYRAYYGKLGGEPHIYSIDSEDPFRLSIVLLTPDVEGAVTDFSAAVIDTTNPDTPIAVVDGNATEWVHFFDTAGRDDYLAGPIFQAGLPAGKYEIRVWNSNNEGAFVLMLGEESSFSIGGLISRYSALPTIKSDFFGKPAYQAFMAPLLLWPLIAALITLAVIVLTIYIVRRRRQDPFTTVSA